MLVPRKKGATRSTAAESVAALQEQLQEAIEQRERVERELSELSARHRLVALLVESTDHSIIAYDLNGVITFWS
jgi:hypothetical protein